MKLTVTSTPTENRIRLELSRRNLETLLAKLDDPLSLKRLEKWEESGNDPSWIEVVAVENEEHYSDREPGLVYMPSSGETL